MAASAYTEELFVRFCRLILREAESSRVFISTGRWNFPKLGVSLAQRHGL